MSGRERLPNSRRSETFDFLHTNASHQQFAYKATVGFYADDRMGEVFLNAAKITTDMDTSARDAAVLLSFALQHGVDPNDIRASMQRDPNGKPLGVIGTLLDILCDSNQQIGE